MRETSARYIAILHEIQHAIFSMEAGNISRQQTERDVAEMARKVPAIDREWRQEKDQ